MLFPSPLSLRYLNDIVDYIVKNLSLTPRCRGPTLHGREDLIGGETKTLRMETNCIDLLCDSELFGG